MAFERETSGPKAIEEKIMDKTGELTIDCLLDCIQALVTDCNHPALKRLKNIDLFLQRYERPSSFIINNRLKPSDFDVIRTIGRGAYGKVDLVRHKTSRQVYAMKLLSKSEMMKRSDTAFYWEERFIMANAVIDWIVKLHFAFQDERYLYMVMDYMPGGNLVNLIREFDIPENWGRFYCAEIVLAVDSLHKMGFVHRDIKPDNMLLDKHGHVKLADFGTCVRMAADNLVWCTTPVGTPDYISPEVLDANSSDGNLEKKPYSNLCDWWSVGVVLYEMLFDDLPFCADTILGTYGNIMKHKAALKFSPEINLSNDAKDLIRSFLTDQSERLGKNGVEEIKAHPFFKTDDWTFENIHQSVPPVIPDLKSDDDSSNFEDVDNNGRLEDNSFPVPKAFAGDQLPFVGFTYSSRKQYFNQVNTTQDNVEVKTSMQDEVSRLEKEKELIQKELSELKIKVESKDKAIETLREREETLTRQIQDADKEMTNRLDELKSEVENRDEKVDVLQRQLHQERLLKGQAVTKLAQIQFSDQLELETEQHFASLYKNQLKEMKEEMEERQRELNQVKHNLELTSSKLQLEIASRKIAEETITNLESDRESKNIAINDLKSKCDSKDKSIDLLREQEQKLSHQLNNLSSLMNNKMESVKQELDGHNEKFELLQRQLNQEKLLKLQAVNKLAEIMYRKDPKKSNKENSYELRKREKECRKLQQNLTTERERFDQTVARLQKNLSETQAALHEESQSKLRLEMELEELKKSQQPGAPVTSTKPIDKPKNRRQRWLRV